MRAIPICRRRIDGAAASAVALSCWAFLHAIVTLVLAPAIGALVPAPALATYVTQERIPTDSPVYRDLERLAERYALMPRFLSTRPLRVQEALGFLEALTQADPEAESDPAYIRTRRALDPAAPDATKPLLLKTAADGDEWVSISPYVSLLYEEDPRRLPEINRDYRAGVQLVASPDSSSVLVVDAYAGTASQGGRGTPDFGTEDALIEGVDFNTWMQEAYVELRAGKVRLLGGHTWLRWGPGREGTLALSDAAPALDMLRAEVTAFRTWRYQQFVSILDPGVESYLAGHRLEWSPFPCVTAGVTELARFDGTSQAPLYLIPGVPYSFWEKRAKTALPGGVPGDTTGVALDKNNVLWSADVSWTFHRGARAWGGFLIDDISFSKDYKPDMIGYQAGLEARGAFPGAGTTRSRVLSASIEYTRVHNFTYSVWHRHDFAAQGFPIGFVLGPDVASLGAEIDYEHGATWEARIRGEWRKKGEGRIGDFYDKLTGGTVSAAAFEGVVERETRVTAALIYTPARWLRLEAHLGASEIKNRRHVASTGTESEAPFRIMGEIRW